MHSIVELLNDVRRVARELGRSPGKKEYDRLGKYWALTITTRMNCRWEEVLKRIGLRHRQRMGRGYVPTEQEIVDDLRRVRSKLGRAQTSKEHEEHGQISVETVKKHLGCPAWTDVLTRFLGVDIEEAKKIARPAYQTTAEKLIPLKALAQVLARAPSWSEASANGIDTQSLRKRVGGSWLDVLKAADLKPNKAVRPSRKHKRGQTAEEMVASVLEVARKLGHAPTVQEYNRLTQGVGSATILRRLGRWSAVTELVGSILEMELRPAEKKPALMGEVSDPVRDMLKSESVEAIKEYFQKQNKASKK